MSLFEKLFSLVVLEKLETGVRVTEEPVVTTQLLLEFKLARSGLNLGGSSLASYSIDPGFRPRFPLLFEDEEDDDDEDVEVVVKCLEASFTRWFEWTVFSGLEVGDISSLGTGRNAGIVLTIFLLIR